MHPLLRGRLSRERAVLKTLRIGALAKFDAAVSRARSVRSLVAAGSAYGAALSKLALDAAILEWHAAAQHHLDALGSDVEIAQLAARAKDKRKVARTAKRVGQRRAIRTIRIRTRAVGDHTGEQLGKYVRDLTAEAAARKVFPRGTVGPAKAVVRELRRRARHMGKRVVVTVMTDADTMGALSVGRHYKRRHVLLQKEWMTDPGSNTCEDCADLDGDVVAYDDDFEDGPPPLHSNCRCMIALRKGDDG